MDESTAISKAHWRGFIAAWLGWAFDGLDGFLYSLVAVPFVRELLHNTADMGEVARKAALIQAVFLFGWAIGGAVFGRIGDRIGRTRTLTLTILTYALFTGASFFAQEWWHLMIFRFVAALGIGGEWAAGSALVSETLHPKHRPWASATLQTGYMVGMILAALTVKNMGHVNGDPRYVFLVGVVPALATVWIRRAVPEPEEWKGARLKQAMPKIGDLFATGIRGTTVLTLSMTSICLTTVWAFLFFSAQVVQSLDEVTLMAKDAQRAVLFSMIITYTLWNIAGNFFATYMAKMIGHRYAMAMLLAGAFLAFYFGFNAPKSLAETQIWFNLAAFTSLGIFAIFPLYIPPLFPTLLRTTGAGFCYNFGRVAAAVGTLIGGGVIAHQFPGLGIWWVSFLYLPGILIALIMPVPGVHEPTTMSA